MTRARLLVPIQSLVWTREIWSELSTGFGEHVVPVLSECNTRKANSDGLSPTDAELVREKSTVGGRGG